ncbi:MULTISPECIES: DUF2628 domain-containing protein [Bradyrhizobium]
MPPRPTARLLRRPTNSSSYATGFHFWAAIAGVIWLAWNRLWLAR